MFLKNNSNDNKMCFSLFLALWHFTPFGNKNNNNNNTHFYQTIKTLK